MSPQQPCPHEHRPGTTVCLHCRHAERLEARARLKVLALRAGTGALVLAAGAAAVITGASVLQARRASGHVQGVATVKHDSTLVPVWSGPDGGEVQQAGEPALTDSAAAARADSANAGAAPHGSVVQLPAGVPLTQPMAPPTITTPKPSAVLPGAPLVPVVAEGRTELPDGLYAERKGGTVYVHFDTPLARTRRRDKLEHVIRATLPTVFGPTADSALARIPAGQLTAEQNPVTELPAKGMWVPLRNGWTLAVWPETRPGQDGPLVVSYRAMVMR